MDCSEEQEDRRYSANLLWLNKLSKKVYMYGGVIFGKDNVRVTDGKSAIKIPQKFDRIPEEGEEIFLSDQQVEVLKKSMDRRYGRFSLTQKEHPEDPLMPGPIEAKVWSSKFSTQEITIQFSPNRPRHIFRCEHLPDGSDHSVEFGMEVTELETLLISMRAMGVSEVIVKVKDDLSAICVNDTSSSLKAWIQPMSMKRFR